VVSTVAAAPSDSLCFFAAGAMIEQSGSELLRGQLQKVRLRKTFTCALVLIGSVATDTSWRTTPRHPLRGINSRIERIARPPR